MTITVVKDYGDGRILYETEIGNGVGIWKGRNPVWEGMEYHTEFEGDLITARQISICPESGFRIEQKDGCTWFTGKAALYNETDKYLSVDLGIGWIDFFLDGSVRSEDILEKTVTIQAGEAEIYPWYPLD